MKAPTNSTSVPLNERILGVSGFTLMIVGFVMLFGGQAGTLKTASPRELEEMPTIRSAPLGELAIDASRPYEEYLVLLRRWNRVSMPPDSSSMHIEIDLRGAPDSIREKIHDLEEELVGVALLNKMGSGNTYEVWLSTSGLIRPGPARPLWRSRKWKSIADYALVPLLLGGALMGTFVVLNTRRTRKG